MRKRIKNSLFLIILTLAAIFSTYNIGAFADTSDNKQVVITVTTNENEADKLYNYLTNNGYSVSSNGKQSMTASLDKAEVPAPTQQNQDKKPSLANLLSFDPVYIYGSLGVTFLILIVLFFVVKVAKRDNGYEEEYYEETYPQYPYYEQPSQQSYNYQGNQNNCMNLFQRLEGMQVQPQCSAYYFNSNNCYGDPFVQQRTDYSNYDDHSQFNIIRNRQR